MRKIAVLALVATVACVLAAGPSAASTQAPTEITVRSSPYGRILFDGRGFALYAFTKDGVGRGSTCTGACARAWPPYIVKGEQRRARGVDAAKLGTIRRSDGRRQLTVAGRPLYYYVGDRAPLQVLCQNVREFGGLWLVVRPGGVLVR
jgi:predicted lipoprotein with Yx(FWY)xxD motif